ncbi:helix-turn-helix domain-containing protein [Nocardia salmonicida]|uniref:helix-turn-helix domain-containing protein n=1 Tax=Nocardia salmonicida TaxID=53431 RepID=UPI0007A39CE8|nr:helix-turn-helix domain-containing protein [Nocardia salmonicida]
MNTESLTAVEQQVLAVLVPGGLLTADTIARNLNVPPRRVARALNSLRRNGDAFRNRHSEWQITAGQGRTERRVAR